MIYYIQVAFLVISLLLTLLFFIYGFNHYYLLSVIHRYHLPNHPPDLSEKRPPVEIHLPVYNERYVVRRLVAACVRMVERYGKEHAGIIVLDDSNDDTSMLVDKIVHAYSAKGIRICVHRRADRRGYKAGALQYALEQSSADFVVIFDADFTPPDDFLLRTIPYFLQDDQLAIIQSRWAHLNRYFNRITSAVAIGIDVHFLIEQTGRYATRCLQNFNGSGGVLRRSALLEAGGWQSDTLAEDLDASYRIQLKGYHVLFLKDLPSPGEIPPTIPSFKKQQARWANGSLRTARKLLPSILTDYKLKLYQRMEAFVHLTGYLLHPMMFTSFLLASLGTIFELDTFLNHSYLLTPFGGTFTTADSLTVKYIHLISWGTMDILIVLSMLAAWITPLVSLKLQNLSIRKNAMNLLMLFILGLGVTVSNTVEAFKALLTDRSWEFKRTPKYANLGTKESWRNLRYQVPLDFVFILELVSVCLGLIAMVSAFMQKHYLILFILVPYTVSFILISLLTYNQSRRQVSI